jgi:nucleotide-binding universal stress UspA family protein
VKAVVWITESTWPACVDAARELHADVTLLHVIDPADIEAVVGAQSALLGRASAPIEAGIVESMNTAQTSLLDRAEARLGRAASRDRRRGRTERQVVAACADGDLLIVARDGDRTRLGPHSLGHATRFVVDHAPCRVLLVWPDEPPSLDTMPPGPGPRHRPRP